jgi:division protein CdvB (Snf7/Vps24/ESCRT-III family)
MTVTGKKELTQLQQAQDHLDQAVSRLESTVTGRRDSAAASSAELDAAREESASLKRVNAEATQRLDGAIGRLKSILEG